MKIVKTIVVFLSIAGLYSCHDSEIEPVTEPEMSFVKTKAEAISAIRTDDGIKFLKNGRLVKKDNF